MHRFARRALMAILVVCGTLALAPEAGAATAPAQVFAPNPVADLGIESLTDQKDADFFSADPVLRRAYHLVTLTDLTSPSTLSGAYVAVKSETGPAAANTGAGFVSRGPREVHADGEIWSRALWDIRRALGARLADTIIIRAQFGFAADTSMRAAAAQTIATAKLYGRPAANAVTAAFAARGLA